MIPNKHNFIHLNSRIYHQHLSPLSENTSIASDRIR